MLLLPAVWTGLAFMKSPRAIRKTRRIQQSARSNARIRTSEPVFNTNHGPLRRTSPLRLIRRRTMSALRAAETSISARKPRAEAARRRLRSHRPFHGSELEGIEYERLMDFVPVKKKAFYVTTADYVTTDQTEPVSSTFRLSGRRLSGRQKIQSCRYSSLVDEEGIYTATPWKGHFVLEDGLDLEIIKWLEGKRSCSRREKAVHNYPHCWRCKTPLLIMRSRPGISRMTRIKDVLVKTTTALTGIRILSEKSDSATGSKI